MSAVQALPLAAACLWLIAANMAAMLPRDNHRKCASVLVVIGVPLLGWVTFALGPVLGVMLMAGGASVLRWPLRAAGRRLRRLGGA
ncbi:uncharacterized protein DUF2484 [Limimaricola soesokkakensis]|uniref:Uncharacterized protein DUF2484 n=1 Tax=Limimaricola soesokkakensis TaxID=1343159 RepID=A0A1X6YDF3_9RHOB|nr:DUF2484 family protein [Limimaricola soesokkakensis]PSK86991.1 uncharacterized protein DUF2484 [Limimaricola soesokkakensis]SLN17967.1 hypothetical protein LOS8367_00363 [Limimaricola soesokkakensis]